MLFEDPYKNIHGQTVDTSGYTYDSSNNLSAHKQNPSNFNNKNSQNALKSIVIIIIFVVITFSLFPALFLFVIDDIPGNSLVNHTYSTYGEKDDLLDNYTLQEIAKKFSLADRTVTFTATHYVEPAYLTRDGSLGIRYRSQAGMVFLTIKTTPYGIGKINSIRANCTKDTTNNCVIINNEYHESDLFDVIIYKTENGMNDYIYYVAISTTLVEIRFNPYTNATREDAKYIPILKMVRDTLTNDSDTPDIDEMITKLELPMNKKIPSIDIIADINFPEKIRINTKATDGSNDTYDVEVTYTPASKTGLKEVDKDTEMDMVVYKTNGGRTYFVFHQGDSKNEYYLTIDRYLYRVEKGQEPRINISSKEELIEALNTLSN